jgi:coproporphyrinogen III oxidase-like Fe-S oxidoreductase
MYRTKEYLERSWDEVKTEIDLASKAFPQTRRVFLADGDALNLPTEKLVRIIEYLYLKLANLERVACYAMPKNLLQKNSEDMDRLRSAGLGMLYLGIETGNDALLKKVTKGATSKGILQACQMAQSHNYILSCMVILGLGGSNYTKQHIYDTAKLVSLISPDYVAALNLQLEDGVYEEFMSKFGEHFSPLQDLEILDELERLISNINPQKAIIFRANHASNVYSLGGTLPDDRKKLLCLLEELKSRPEILKPKILRRF